MPSAAYIEDCGAGRTETDRMGAMGATMKGLPAPGDMEKIVVLEGREPYRVSEVRCSTGYWLAGNSLSKLHSRPLHTGGL